MKKDKFGEITFNIAEFQPVIDFLSIVSELEEDERIDKSIRQEYVDKFNSVTWN
jgi:hypothetical protein